MNTERYDIAVIGAGPAGLSAAITAVQRNKSVLVIGAGKPTCPVVKAERVDNYLGFYGVTGAELLDKYYEHAAKAGVGITDRKASQIADMGGYYGISAGDMMLEANAVILALGTKWGGKIKGESEFLGKGLSYCATCDGMLYRGKSVVVIGEGEETPHEVEFLSGICERVILITKKTVDISGGNVIVKAASVKEIRGDSKVTSVIAGGEETACDGVFIVRDSVPANALIYGIETENGAIVTDKQMRTNLKGVFAAGDCAGKPFQISKAVGEGLIAALSAVMFLSE